MDDVLEHDPLDAKKRYVRSLTGSRSFLNDKDFLTQSSNHENPVSKDTQQQSQVQHNKQGCEKKQQPTTPNYY